MKALLEYYYQKHNQLEQFNTPDPLIVLKKYIKHQDFELIALICALFAYGSAVQIVKFLEALDFNQLQRKNLKVNDFPYYRFQTREDVCNFFRILKKIRANGGIKSFIVDGYQRNGIIGGINACIDAMYKSLETPLTYGLKHLLGQPVSKDTHSPLKRYNLFLRWLVRKDNIDFGYWKEIDTKDLLLPLDRHTFRVSQKLGLLKRKSYDLKSVFLVTQTLKQYDKNDPIKYDFSLYRIGQEKIIL